MTFQDSTGEDPAGADITTIVVSNTDAGVITFRINMPNRPTLGQDMLIELYVDTDNNVQTGDPELAGTDYAMQVIRGEIALYRWDGTGFTRRFGDPSAVTLAFSYANGITIRIAASELGNTRRFRFFTDVVTGLVVDPVTGDISCGTPPCPVDIAPGGAAGLYPYEVKLAPATLQVRRFTPTPAAPLAGKPFALRLQAVRSDTGAAIRSGRVTCVGRIGSARLVGSGRFVGGTAVCSWRIPATAKGKRFRGTITIVFEGLRATRSYSRAIR